MASLLNIGQKSLTDLVRGIRSNKKNESQYISQALQEIKEELRSNDTQKKSVAVQKLTYVSNICFVSSDVTLVTNVGLRYVLGRVQYY